VQANIRHLAGILIAPMAAHKAPLCASAVLGLALLAPGASSAGMPDAAPYRMQLALTEPVQHDPVQHAPLKAQPPSSIATVSGWLRAGNNQAVLNWYNKLAQPNAAQIELGAWAHIQIGVGLTAAAVKQSATDIKAAHNQWREAGDSFRQALAIKPDSHDAFYNWGLALARQADALAAAPDLDGARTLWRQVYAKYAQALAIKPDMADVIFNWGNTLARDANATAAIDLPVARSTWLRAGEKYQEVLAINPKQFQALNGWGLALAKEAAVVAATDSAAAHVLLQQSNEKYQQAQAIAQQEKRLP
jgi:tetratricopeptide (TPR) repeat protein